MIISIISFIGLFYLSYKFKIRPFLTLLLASFLSGILLQIGITETLYLIFKGFFNIVILIGPIIITGTLLGKFLNETGTSRKMVNTFISSLGIRNIPISLNIIGFIISIPVFCDAAFILMSSIVKDLSKITKKNIIFLSICLATGLYSAHVFVPPTPGPIAASAIIGADIGLLFIIGIIVGSIVSLSGYFWLRFLFKKELKLNLRQINSNELVSNKNIISFLPVFFPILLISASAIIKYPELDINQSQFIRIIEVIGNPEIALLIGFVITLIFVKRDNVKDTPQWLIKSLTNSFEILLITGAGGAIGYIIRESGVINDLSLSNVSGLASILSIFFIAALVKTIQGSSTVAIVTTCAITAPLIQSIGMTSELEKVILIISIGSGA
ncbi:SLC13 family permease, partial [Flavobacteriaceae bacterium]|nr:SLC13 family permease [Flavobacteriaceae bacterium]